MAHHLYECQSGRARRLPDPTEGARDHSAASTPPTRGDEIDHAVIRVEFEDEERLCRCHGRNYGPECGTDDDVMTLVIVLADRPAIQATRIAAAGTPTGEIVSVA
jgi:hypothetical protein